MDILTSEELEHYTRNKIIMNDKYKRESFYRYHSFIENIQNDESMGDLIPKESIDYKNYLKYLNRLQRTYNSFNNRFEKTPEYERKLIYRNEISHKTIYRKHYNTYPEYYKSYKRASQKIYKESNPEQYQNYYKQAKETEEYKKRNAKNSLAWYERNKNNIEYKERKKQFSKAWHEKVKNTLEYKARRRELSKKYYERDKAKRTTNQ